jgi:CRP-like cAMP-binding protein
MLCCTATQIKLSSKRDCWMQQILALSELFAGLDDKALQQLTSAATLKNVRRNEIIFHEGDAASFFCIVGEGKVKVFKFSAEGKEQILLIAEQGDSFAEAALFAGGKFPASAQALEDSRVVVINRDKFVSLLGSNPDLAVNLIGRLSSLLRQMTKLVEGLSLTDVTTRLMQYLVDGIEDDSPEPCTIVLTQKKSILAAQLGTIPETLSRSFARLVKDGLIRIDGPKIEIIDLPRLRNLAGTD